MAKQYTLRLYLPDFLRAKAEAGEHRFMKRVTAAVEHRGWTVEIHGDSRIERASSLARDGYSLVHMQDPLHARQLCMRPVYFFPIWSIEPTQARWDYAVAHARFDPSVVSDTDAKRFGNNRRDWNFKDFKPRTQGHVYMPLQGRLSDHRSFQTMSPLDMVRTTLTYETRRKVIATLHPKEVYLPSERAALIEMETEFPNFEVRDAPPTDLLAGADYVVTQNSSVAYSGLYLHKPAILFGKIDFHHICLNVDQMGAPAAFDAVGTHAPPYDHYLFWFVQMMAINANRDGAEQKIRQAMRRHGWDI